MSSIASAFSPHVAGATTNTSTDQSNPVTDPLANESTFLTLLVSQLQNQDPLSPTDSNQFVSQLTAYSQLEQLIGIHGNTTSLASATTSTTTGTGGTQTPTGAGV